ncbi:hypothetical protein BB561_004760 [Smittium simulii]|uniref:Uncharacterized protein n=1 Tax=Smittium simulii TaxID=133385 RepID=A0A2T9YEG4_9FUNG|nr:hypothetical protein BB561_004760 [Smittium simulii]
MEAIKLNAGQASISSSLSSKKELFNHNLTISNPFQTSSIGFTKSCSSTQPVGLIPGIVIFSKELHPYSNFR